MDAFSRVCAAAPTGSYAIVWAKLKENATEDTAGVASHVAWIGPGQLHGVWPFLAFDTIGATRTQRQLLPMSGWSCNSLPVQLHVCNILH